MLDHVSFSVTDFHQSVLFYDETLKLLGIERFMIFETEKHRVAGYGSHGKPFFWIGSVPVSVEASSPNEYIGNEYIGQARGFHVAFRAPSVETIHAWHAKCLALGATDNGKPGPRPEYHAGYYAAFIIDLNGWRIEAVLHDYFDSI